MAWTDAARLASALARKRMAQARMIYGRPEPARRWGTPDLLTEAKRKQLAATLRAMRSGRIFMDDVPMREAAISTQMRKTARKALTPRQAQNARIRRQREAALRRYRAENPARWPKPGEDWIRA